MSGTKRAIKTVYADEWNRQHEAIRHLENKNRQLARQYRENNVKQEIAAAERRTAENIGDMQQQMAQAARKAQRERAENQRMMKQTMAQVAGIQTEINQTQNIIRDLKKDIYYNEKAARQEREKIRQEVQRSQKLIMENRKKIDRNYNEMKTEFKKVMEEMKDLERKRKLEKSTAAAQLIDQSFSKSESIPEEWVARVEAHKYRQAQQDLNKATEHFKQENFDMARDMARVSYNQLADVAAKVEKFREEYETYYKEASTALAAARGSLDHLNSENNVELGAGNLKKTVKMKDLTTTWYGDQVDLLLKETKVLHSQLENANTPQELKTVTQRADEITDKANEIQEGVFEKNRKHEERVMMINGIVRALAAGLESPKPPRLKEPGDLNSDIIIEHDKEPTIVLPLGGEAEFQFKSDNEKANMEILKQYQQGFRSEGIHMSQFQRVDRSGQQVKTGGD